MVKGTFNGQLFRAVLEPDGEGSHWFRVNKDMQSRVKSNEGGVAVIEIEPINAWSDPELPADIQDALAADPKAHALWRDITPMARWDWIRWVDSVKLIETRNERPARLCSMLRSGKRRPCCFNRALYTPPKSAEIIA
jgi:hypothetical protein